MKELKIGDIAICKKKQVGIIITKTKYSDSNGIVKYLYKGINIKPPHNNWQSLQPSYLANLGDTIYKYILKLVQQEELQKIADNWDLENRFG